WRANCSQQGVTHARRRHLSQFLTGIWLGVGIPQNVMSSDSEVWLYLPSYTSLYQNRNGAELNWGLVTQATAWGW
ncbi:MAG: hypothetical protein KC643_30550, partial [Nitrospira sp.]|nr:hypothetical protein [Nitrospira sp.]